MLLFSIDFTTHLYNNNNNNNWDFECESVIDTKPIKRHQNMYIACCMYMSHGLFLCCFFQSSTASTTAFFQQTKERHIDLERHEVIKWWQNYHFGMNYPFNRERYILVWLRSILANLWHLQFSISNDQNKLYGSIVCQKLD